MLISSIRTWGIVLKLCLLLYRFDFVCKVRGLFTEIYSPPILPRLVCKVCFSPASASSYVGTTHIFYDTCLFYRKHFYKKPEAEIRQKLRTI